MGVLPSREPPGPYTAAPFSHTQGSLSATGAKSFLTLVYCRPLEQVGYKDVAYFSATFKKLVGMSPSEYQDTSG